MFANCWEERDDYSSQTNYSYIGYIMFSALGTGDNVIVTNNEEIL